MIKARLYKHLNEDWDSKKEKQTISILPNYIPIPDGLTPFEAFRQIKNEYKQVQGPLYRNSNGKNGGTYAWAEDILRMLYKDGVYYDTVLRTKFLHSLETFEQETCPIENLQGKTPQEITSQFGNLLKGYTAKSLIDEFYPIYLERQREEQENAKKETYGHSDYEVVSVKDTQEASEYEDYTDWCVTKEQDHYESYAGKYGRFYFLLKKGFEDIPEQKGEDYPLDEYGKSMFAVCVDSEGMITNITCRWNHGAFGSNDISNADNVIKPKDLSKIVNMNVYEQCKPYSKQELRAMGYIPFAEVQELLNKGEKPEDVFEYVDDFEEGFARVKLNGKWNFIDEDCTILSKTWFDVAGDFIEGFASVKLNGKYNFIDTKGSILSDTWFDYAWDFQEGFVKVWLNDKYNFIDTKGHLYDEDKQPITESFTGLQKRIYEAIQFGIRKGLKRF